MKKGVGCLAFLAIGVIFYAAWVRYPPSRREAAVQAIMQRANERHKDEQKTAKDPTSNAYLDPKFLPFWGRLGMELTDSNEPRALMLTVSNYFDVGEGKDTDLEGGLKAKDPEVLSAFLGIEKFYPHIHNVVNKPHFTVPYDTPPDWTSPQSTYPIIGALGHTLSSYAEYLVLQGKSDAALEVAGDEVRLGWLVGRQQGPLARTQISLSAQSTGQRTLAMVVQTSPEELGQARLERVASLLKETQLRPQEWVDAFETEMYLLLNTVPKLERGEPVEGLGPWPPLPGLFSREVRLYKNDFIGILETLRVGETPDQQGFQPENFRQSWWLGRHGELTRQAVPNYGRVMSNHNRVRQRQSFLHLYIHLLLARRASGHWPASLKELQSSGYKVLDGLDLGQVQYKVQGNKFELKLVPTAKEAEVYKYLDRPVEKGMEKWSMLEGLDLVMHEPAYVSL